MSSSTSLTRLPGPGGQPSRVFRRGDTVLRPSGPWTPTVHALLRHLERAGFAGAPRVVGDGFDDQGREVLTFIEGTFVDPHAWSDDQIWHAGRLLRALHDAAARFRPPPDAVWYPWPFRAGLGEPGTARDTRASALSWLRGVAARSMTKIGAGDDQKVILPTGSGPGSRRSRPAPTRRAPTGSGAPAPR